METSVAHYDHSTQATEATITSWTTKDLAEILMGIEPSIKEETHNTTLQTHCEAGITILSQWT